MRPPFLPPNRTIGWTPYAWLIYLGFFFIAPLQRGRGAGDWALTIVGTVVFLAAYFRAYWERGPRLLALIAFQAALGVAFSPVNDGASVLFVYAASFAARLDRTRDALRVIAAVMAVAAGTAWATDAPGYYWVTALVIVPLIAGVNIHFTQVGRADAKLRLAQREIEHLAAVAERERIARDLHDVLGHTLSLIILKSELASKLAERDPQRAAREIRDVEQVSRKALGEVREAIRGYRATLDDEAARARSLLDAAGIRGEFDLRARPPDRARDEVLALVLRETVTNAVRHSGARVCRVVADASDAACWLVVEDDGRGAAALAAREAREGAGLRGMRERIEALGGTLTVDASRGMRLTATLPVPGARAAAAAEGAA
jgi:two-component system sensor histidine kinase DesK